MCYKYKVFQVCLCSVRPGTVLNVNILIDSVLRVFAAWGNPEHCRPGTDLKKNCRGKYKLLALLSKIVFCRTIVYICLNMRHGDTWMLCLGAARMQWRT